MRWFSLKRVTGRSPVSEYIALFGRTSWENFARRKWRLMNWAARETATGLKKGKAHWAVALTQPAWVEIAICRPECRSCSTSGRPTSHSEFQHRVADVPVAAARARTGLP